MGFDLAGLIGGSIGSAFKEIMSVFKVDPTKALEVQSQLETIRLNLEGQLVQQITAQIDVNKQEAASPSMFVAGWRPFVGWVCGSAFAWAFVIQPLANFFLTSSGHTTQLPTLNLSQMMPVLLGMLGLGGLRTYEKVQRVAGSAALK